VSLFWVFSPLMFDKCRHLLYVLHKSSNLYNKTSDILRMLITRIITNKSNTFLSNILIVYKITFIINLILCSLSFTFKLKYLFYILLLFYDELLTKSRMHL